MKKLKTKILYVNCETKKWYSEKEYDKLNIQDRVSEYFVRIEFIGWKKSMVKDLFDGFDMFLTLKN